MFIMLMSGAMLNLLWLNDCYLDKSDKTVVIYDMINGSIIKESFENETVAQTRVDKVKEAMEKCLSGGGSGTTLEWNEY